MFLLKSKQLQSDYHRSNHLIRSKLPARLNDRLETFSHAISLFWHKVFINIGPDLLDFAFECGNRPRFASLELGLHVSPYLFNGIQVRRVGGHSPWGPDLMWFGTFSSSHSFVALALWADAPSWNVQPRSREPNILSKSGFTLVRTSRYLGPVMSSS